MRKRTNLKTALAITVFLAWVLSICVSVQADPIGWSIEQLTDNSKDDDYPQISGSNVFWRGRDVNDTYEIFFWDGNTTTQLTNNNYDESPPIVSGPNVVWYASDGNDDEIFFWDGNTITQLTDNSYNDGQCDISGSKVVWVGWDGSDTEIFLFSWDGNTTTQLTGNSYDDYKPRISGSNVTWYGGEMSSSCEIFFWNGSTTQITSNSYYDHDPQISGTNVVWDGFNPGDGDYEIFFWDDPCYSPTRVTSNSYNDDNPQISGSNIVWEGYDGSDLEIFLWDPDPNNPTTQLTNNSYNDRYPKISGSKVVWKGYDGSDYEIFFWDGSTTTQLTDNSYDDRHPHVSGGQVVWEGHDGNDYEIFMATALEIDYYVDDNAPSDPGPGDPNISDPNEDGSLNFPFDAIQKAIDAATDGNTICVLDGTYTGTGNYDVNFVGKAITVFSWNGPEDCVVDCNSNARGFNFNSAEDGNSVLDGFTIMNGMETRGGGIYCNGSSPIIRNCMIKDNDCWGSPQLYGGGIYCLASSPEIINCTISNNSAWGMGGPGLRVGGGIYCNLSNPNIINCTISENESRQFGSGIYCGMDSDPTVRDSTIRDNSFDERGIELYDANCTLLVAGVVHIISDDVYGSGSLQMDPNANLNLDDAEVFCDMTGVGTMEIEVGAEATIDGSAVIDFGDPCDPNVRGTIDCEGLLQVKDNAQILNANINITRATFEDDVNVTNCEIHVDSNAPYGQFFIDHNVTITYNDIYADGDRYMDLDPNIFSGLFVHNRIFVTITEGVGQDRGGLFELRGDPNFADPNCDPNEFMCQMDPCTIPDCNLATWTIERLELIDGAKLTLTNRFGFQPPYDFGGEYEVLYVKSLILGEDSIFNTSFSHVYYESLTMEPNANTRNEPLLGFSLSNIALDDQIEFIVRVIHNNFEDPVDSNNNRIHVERVEGLEPDPNGMMRMRNLVDTDPCSPTYEDLFNARAKGLFAKAEEDEILVRFEYLFDSNDPNVELIVYLSDEPELLDYNDPCRANHYLQVASLRPPPPGRYGSPDSNHFGVFEKVVSSGSLDFIRGVRIELELKGPNGTSILIDNWDPFVTCTYCGDVTGDFGVSARDFLTVLGEFGQPSSGTSRQGDPLFCTNSNFSADGYIDQSDLMGYDWTSYLYTEGLIGSFCFPCYHLPLKPCSKSGGLMGGTALAPLPKAGGLPSFQGPLLIAGKRFDAAGEDFLSDRLYEFDEEPNFTGGPFAMDKDRTNGKLVRDYDGKLYQINLDEGLVSVSDGNAVIPREDSDSGINEPRYGESATVYVGFQGSGNSSWGRPMLDAAFDSAGYVYVTPVVVSPAVNEPYIASAKLELVTGDPPYNVLKIFDDGPLAADNEDPNNCREIEVDEQGRVYVVNRGYDNNSDILRVYDANGAVIKKCHLQNVGIQGPTGLCCSSYDTSRLYVASSLGQPDACSTSLYIISKQDLLQSPGDPNVQTITVNGMGHITDITENPTTGMVWAVGFTIPKYVKQLPAALADMPEFYEPNLVEIPYGSSGPVQAISLSDANDLALPLSIVYAKKCGGADLDGGDDVDFGDFEIMASQWLEVPGSPSADIAPETPDGIVNMLDLAVLAEHWLEENCASP